ncbi:hypothetical protein ABZV14_18860 [Streptosporangium canum]
MFERLHIFLSDLAIGRGSIRDYAVTELGVDELITALREWFLSP